MNVSKRSILIATGLIAVGLATFLMLRGPLLSSAGDKASQQASGLFAPSDKAASGGGDGSKAGGRGEGGARASGREDSKGGSRSGSQRGGRPPSLVVTATVAEGLVNDRLKVIGNGRAWASASVVPLTSGLLIDVRVSSGQQVAVGDVLAVLDSSEEQIAHDRAARAQEDAARDAKRLEALYRSQTTTEVERNNALAAEADASLALRDAFLKLTRRSITAPIAGSIGIIDVQVGNYITSQDVIATIDDRSRILVQFRVPERLATAVSVGQPVAARAIARTGLSLSGEITAIGSRIEADSRTLPVRASIDNAADALRPGMSFELQLQFEGERYPSIDPLAVQWDSEGSFVWQLDQGKVQRVGIRIIQRNTRSVLVASELAVGDEVVTEGVLSLRPGSQVRTAGGSRLPADEGAPDADKAAKAAKAASKAGSGT